MINKSRIYTIKQQGNNDVQVFQGDELVAGFDTLVLAREYVRQRIGERTGVAVNVSDTYSARHQTRVTKWRF